MTIERKIIFSTLLVTIIPFGNIIGPMFFSSNANTRIKKIKTIVISYGLVVDIFSLALGAYLWLTKMDANGNIISTDFSFMKYYVLIIYVTIFLIPLIAGNIYISHINKKM